MSLLPLLLAMLLPGCADLPSMRVFQTGGGGLPVLAGASVSENRTPVDDALVCYGQDLVRAKGSSAKLAVGVGDVRDFTGRIDDLEGAVVTQGAALMVYSALANIGPAIRIHERLDPRVAELELGYLDRQRLGDGRMHRPSPDAEPAPWLPYMGGSILKSDYYIVGGVTELNYTLATGGAEVSIAGLGGRGRFVLINVAVDLRIVNTETLVVEHAVSMQKQVIGREANLDVFRFFGSRLFDIQGGTRMTEPMQMAVRSVLQLGTLDLLEAVSGVSNQTCVRRMHEGLEEELPRPMGANASGDWPPDPGTAISEAEFRALTTRAQDMRSTVDPNEVTEPVERVDARPRAATEESPAGAVVVGAATNFEAARGIWLRLKERQPSLFGQVAADIVSVNREGGPFLVVVEDRRKTAQEFCAESSAAGIDCAIAPSEVIAARAIARSREQSQ